MSTAPSEPVPDRTGDAAHPARAPAPAPALDPYLVWAQRTGFRYLLHGMPAAVRLAGELREGHSLEGALKSVRALGVAFEARAILGTRFFTATLDTASSEACNALLRHACFVLAEPGMRPLGVPVPPEVRAGTAARIGPPASEPTTPLSNDVVIGVVDGRCGFANEGFCSAGESRLDRYWDQGDAPAASAADAQARWSVPAEFGYGRALGGQALDAIAQGLSHAGATAQRAALEKAVYRRLGHRLPEDADWTHGTHVLSTVLDTLSSQVEPGVVYVQLPDAALRDTSARWTAAYVLDAIDYIVRHVREGARAVINLSLGAFGGPHDGTSLVERAIDAIARSDARVTFVVAAGNAGKVLDDGTGAVKRCRASFTLRGGASRTLGLDIDRADDTESFLELWTPAAEVDPAGLSVALTHTRSPQMTSGEVGPRTARDISRNGSVVAMVGNNTGSTSVPNGQGQMVLIALGHTQGGQAAPAPIGLWEVAVRNLGKQAVTVNAWIERRDMPGELLGYRPQYGFIDNGEEFEEASSLGSLANGDHPIVVGALEFDEARCRYGIADYSSRGSRADAKPQAYTLGKRTARGFLSGTAKELAGTSIAAARITAALASALAGIGASKDTGRAIELLARLASERWETRSTPTGSLCKTVALDDELTNRLVILPRQERTGASV